MPIHKIGIDEYECAHCGHKWTNRLDGNNGSIPKKCAKCKRGNWNDPTTEEITPKENGLRRRIRGFNNLYIKEFRYDARMKNIINWDPELPEKFLKIHRRPTIDEMRLVIRSSPLHRTSSATLQHKSIPRKPDPNDPAWSIPDNDKYEELIIEEAKRRRKLMLKIIKTRNPKCTSDES
jgi:hypothetical protein